MPAQAQTRQAEAAAQGRQVGQAQARAGQGGSNPHRVHSQLLIGREQARS